MLAARNPSDWLTPLIFFLLVTTVFPLAVGPAPDTLRRIAPGVIWSLALLSTLLSQDSLFRGDAEDGNLEQLLLSSQPLVLAVLAKTAAHWLAYGTPLILLAPLLGMWLQLPVDVLGVLLLTLSLGTGIFSLLAAFCAALLTSARRNRFLGALLALPLCLPAVIFSAAAVTADAPAAPLLLLAALFALSLTVLPAATAAALRVSAGFR